jgi:DNA-binding LacI/PurR family transcriptional regulator
MAREPKLTALFATNDLLAIGALQGLATLGRKVPEEVSVIGITDIQLAHQVRPSLTTVAINTEAIAGASIELLIRLIREPQGDEPPAITAPAPVLVRRQSTTAAHD